MPLVETSTTDDWTDLINMSGVGDPGYQTIVLDPIVAGATSSCLTLSDAEPWPVAVARSAEALRVPAATARRDSGRGDHAVVTDRCARVASGGHERR